VCPSLAPPEVSLLAAARAGDHCALETLVRSSLPVVYTIVRRALGGGPDVDDVVQDTMLRVLRELRALRAPESFRAWLMTIATRQVGTYLERLRTDARRIAALDDVLDAPEPDAESLALLRIELSGQRRQVARAGRWLDPEDLSLLSLWWLETAGRLTRTELAAALGQSVAHVGVRVQRMRNRLELSRSLVAALDARPLCAGLVATLQGWDGVPGPLWRKRIARHVRSCPRCGRAFDGLVPLERLLVCPALLPLPMGSATQPGTVRVAAVHDRSGTLQITETCDGGAGRIRGINTGKVLPAQANGGRGRQCGRRSGTSTSIY
jgi:RNA polymerase sigma factor (sigma-70 family)